MALKPGYKQTDVGVVPEDWEVARLRDCFDISAGGDADKNTMHPSQDSRFPFPVYANAIKSRGLYGFSSHARQPSGSLTITARGELGHAEFRDHEYTAIGRLLVLRPTGLADADFIARYINECVDFAIESTGVPQLTAPQVGRYSVAIPPFPEQRAIAKALADADAAIDAMTRLLAKKRDLRTAAMQRLLAGEERLEGFATTWRTIKLCDHVSFLKNGAHSRAQLTADDPVRYLHYGDIHASANEYLDLSVTNLPRLPEEDARRIPRLANGDLVLVDASEDLSGIGKSVEICGLGEIELVAGQHTIAARFDKAVLADGFKAYLQHIPDFTRHLRRLAAGTKVYATNRKHIASAEILLPEPEEQQAIAAGIGDMSAEIAALEQRLAKTTALKQAMMQALLTGRVRLHVADVERTDKEPADA